MLNTIRNFFKKADKLTSAVVMAKTILVPVKTAAYHEIIPVQSRGYLVRVYRRSDSTLLEEVEELTLEDTKSRALKLLEQYNKGEE